MAMLNNQMVYVINYMSICLVVWSCEPAHQVRHFLGPRRTRAPEFSVVLAAAHWCLYQPNSFALIKMLKSHDGIHGWIRDFFSLTLWWTFTVCNGKIHPCYSWENNHYFDWAIFHCNLYVHQKVTCKFAFWFQSQMDNQANLQTGIFELSFTMIFLRFPTAAICPWNIFTGTSRSS